jgi:hypothetical protein
MHALPDADTTALFILVLCRRVYQIVPAVVVAITIGMAGRAHRGEIHGETRHITNGAATAPRAGITNTTAIHNSYCRRAGGTGAAGFVGADFIER